MERAAIVVTLASPRDELLDVLRRLNRRELKAERPEIGGDYGLDIRG